MILDAQYVKMVHRRVNRKGNVSVWCSDFIRKSAGSTSGSVTAQSPDLTLNKILLQFVLHF